jgi:hypothetical protein
MGDVTTPIAHQTPIVGKESGDGQTEECGQNEPMGQISGRSVEDEDGGLGYETMV